MKKQCNMHAFKKIYFLRHVKTRIGILASYQNSTSCTCKMVANVSHCHHYYLLSLFISSFNDQSKWLYTGSFEYTNNAESYAIERVLSANSFACFRWRDVKQIGRKGRKNSARVDQFFHGSIRLASLHLFDKTKLTALFY